MDEAEFRQVLSPEFMVKTRVGIGGPQPAEVERQLGAARATLDADKAWMETVRGNIRNADARLDSSFRQLLAP
jgi:argininosuccinate lyase